MKGNVFIHSKYNLKNIIIIFILTLIPLILYGTYKNGYLLYQKDLINIYRVFKVFYLIFISIGIDLLIRVIFKKRFRLDYNFLSMIIIPLFIPFKTTYLIYGISILLLSIIYELLNKIIKFNRNTFIILSIIIITMCFKGNIFLNYLERQDLYVFTKFDLFAGRAIGGFCTSSILLGCIFFIINTVFNNYKWIISLSCISIYVILCLIVFKEDLNYLLNSNLYLASFIVLPIDAYAPRKKRYQLIYGLIVGITCFILIKYINIYYGVYIGILLVSIMYNILFREKNVLN